MLEAQSAFAGKVRTEVILPVDADVAMDQIFMEIASGLVEIVSLEDVHLDNARTLVRKYGYLRRMKTLDAIQLALALDMHRTGELDVFVAADKLLAELAAFEGLTVEDPENTP